ncbi:MAG: ATP-binding protein [Phycisphaerales bacterium]|nr:ATP-binding protein [Phycisphaerales bacterium]
MLVRSLQTAIAEKEKLIAGYQTQRAKLVSKGSEERVKRLVSLTNAAEVVRGYLRSFAYQKQSLLSLKEEVRDHRTRQAPEMLRVAKIRHKPSGLNEDEWGRFLLEYKGEVDTAISACLKKNASATERWKGKPPPTDADPKDALIDDQAVLDQQPLGLLDAEIDRLQQAVSVDKDTADRYAVLSKRIAEEYTALERSKERLADCEGARERRKTAQQERVAAYVRLFESIVAEESELTALYAPLQNRIQSGQGALQKLAFTVGRKVDLDRWAQRGEELLDLRKQGTLQGRGTLKRLADSKLKKAWETGNPIAVGEAMSAFVSQHNRELLEMSTAPPSEQSNYRDWLKRFAKWLYSTDHISLQYSIDYEGVDIRKLSPGTRGIVLLLLYLALDDADDRPLIIDQPEENLDPKSIYDELVGLFRAAKDRRQVLLVTHNANLVVNTDADQIIVAQAGSHATGQLPPITYLSGGLESAEIRELVCNTLEGGEEAFRQRARRLRVRLNR